MTLATEPITFDAKVRQPGSRYLKGVKVPVWRGHEYWRRAIADLRLAYSSICCYSGERIHGITGSATVDHFHPKEDNPSLAYEWKNMRLACGRLNSRKGRRLGFLDPFEVQPGWIALGFPSLLVERGPLLPESMKDRFLFTVGRLGLNDETSVGSRLRWVRSYCLGDISMKSMRENAPFVASELDRQGLVDAIKTRMVFEPN